MGVNVLPWCSIVFLTCFLYGQNLAIHIEIRPEVFNMVKDDAVQISCLQMDQGIAYQEIFALEIAKDGKPFVVLRQNSQPLITNEMDTRLKAVGHIDKDISKSYLNLTLTSPHSQDCGVYTCVMDYLDEINVIKIEKDSKTLTEQKLDLQSIEALLSFLKQKMLSNEMDYKNEISDMKKQVKELNEITKNQSSLIQNFTYKVRELKETTSKQSSLIQDLTYRTKFSTAFSVTNLHNYIHSVNGKTLILPNIITLQGTGYDVTTGVFTAPTPGLYVFHVVVDAFRANDDFELELMANSKLLAKLSTDEDARHYTQSSISSVVDLKAGDRVYAVMRDDGFTLNDGKYTVFTGYLIKAW